MVLVWYSGNFLRWWCAIAGTITSSVKRMMRCGLKGGGRVASWGGDRRSPAVNPSSSVRMPAGGGGGCCSGLRSRASDLAGLEMASLRGGVGGLFRSSPRYGRLQATAAGASRVSGYGFAALESRIRCFCGWGWCHGCGTGVETLGLGDGGTVGVLMRLDSA